MIVRLSRSWDRAVGVAGVRTCESRSPTHSHLTAAASHTLALTPVTLQTRLLISGRLSLCLPPTLQGYEYDNKDVMAAILQQLSGNPLATPIGIKIGKSALDGVPGYGPAARLNWLPHPCHLTPYERICDVVVQSKRQSGMRTGPTSWKYVT